MLSKISLMTSGPGLHVAWESLLNEKERSAAAEANRERDEVYEKLKAAGVLVKVDGTLPIDKMLKKRGS